MAGSPDFTGSEKADVLAQIVAQVLAIGAAHFQVNRNYDQENVWAIKGPVEFSVASFRLDSAKARELRNALEKGQTTVVVNGSEYLLVVETSDSAGDRGFRVTIKPKKP
jgi:hypothetical protein